MIDIVVTTVRECSLVEEQLGKSFAEELNSQFISRENTSLARLKARFGVDNILVATKNGPVIDTPEGELFFHLSMAELRIKNLENGKHDHMVQAMELNPGMTVLDCTLGLATDAIVASFVTGQSGKVVGLESAAAIAAVTRYGLRNFVSQNSRITEALRRITVENVNYRQRLAELPDQSFDIVFFDPMFRKPIKGSSNMRPLRGLAENAPLCSESIAQARRIARQRVVVKESRYSGEFNRLGIATMCGGKYSNISYGIIKAGG